MATHPEATTMAMPQPPPVNNNPPPPPPAPQALPPPPTEENLGLNVTADTFTTHDVVSLALEAAKVQQSFAVSPHAAGTKPRCWARAMESIAFLAIYAFEKSLSSTSLSMQQHQEA